jgi:membrane protein DedA with SNARE-associated domain
MHIASLLSLLLTTDPVDIAKSIIGLPVEIFHLYGSLVRWAADSVHSLFETYGYWVVFFGTLSENVLFLGLIVPGVLVVLLAGLSAYNGSLELHWALLIGIAGTILGDTISYCMGRFGWSRFAGHSLLKGIDEKVREPLLRRGVWFVLLYHFAGYTRVVGPTAAGFLKMPYRKWAPADHLGASLWVAAYLALGYGLGAAGLDLNDTNGRWFNIMEIVLLVVVVTLGLLMFKQAERAWYAHQASVHQRQAHEQEAREHEVHDQHEAPKAVIGPE